MTLLRRLSLVSEITRSNSVADCGFQNLGASLSVRSMSSSVTVLAEVGSVPSETATLSCKVCKCS